MVLSPSGNYPPLNGPSIQAEPMPDEIFKSVHLEGMPRRDEFRAARSRLVAACGDRTIHGDESKEVDVNGTTALSPAKLNGAFWLDDGVDHHPLVVGVNTVGRLSENFVVLRDQHVSRRHCAVVVHRDGTCEVHDVASKNGTILNGRKINGPTRLRPGDQLLLCSKKLVFRCARVGVPDRERTELTRLTPVEVRSRTFRRYRVRPCWFRTIPPPPLCESSFSSRRRRSHRRRWRRPG